MALTVAQITSLARLFAQDKTTNLPGLTDADYLDILNAVFSDYWENMGSPRLKHASSTDAFSGGFAQGALRGQITTLTNIVDIVAVFREASATATAGVPMERESPGRVLSKQGSDTTQGTPALYSVYRTGDVGVNQTNLWQVNVWRLPLVLTYFSVLYRYHAPTLTAGTPDLSNPECYQLARVVAGVAASLEGRSERFISNILRGLPEAITAVAGRMVGTVAIPRGSDRL